MSYHRINIDGKSISETRLLTSDNKAGKLVVITNDKFDDTSDGKGQVYALNVCRSQGLRINDTIPMGASVDAEYVQPNRELVVRAGVGSYSKDQGLKILAGQVIVAGGGDEVFAYSQDDVTLADGELLRIKVK